MVNKFRCTRITAPERNSNPRIVTKCKKWFPLCPRQSSLTRTVPAPRSSFLGRLPILDFHAIHSSRETIRESGRERTNDWKIKQIYTRLLFAFADMKSFSSRAHKLAGREKKKLAPTCRDWNKLYLFAPNERQERKMSRSVIFSFASTIPKSRITNLHLAYTRLPRFFHSLSVSLSLCVSSYPAAAVLHTFCLIHIPRAGITRVHVSSSFVWKNKIEEEPEYTYADLTPEKSKIMRFHFSSRVPRGGSILENSHYFFARIFSLCLKIVFSATWCICTSPITRVHAPTTMTTPNGRD